MPGASSGRGRGADGHGARRHSGQHPRREGPDLISEARRRGGVGGDHGEEVLVYVQGVRYQCVPRSRAAIQLL